MLHACKCERRSPLIWRNGCPLLSNVIPEIGTLHAPIIATWFGTPMHPMGESFSGATCDTRFRCLPSVRLGVVKSFVSWHVRLACQLLATNVACRKCVGWSQGLNISLTCERQCHLPEWGLPRSPWPCCLSPGTYGTSFFIKECDGGQRSDE